MSGEWSLAVSNGVLGERREEGEKGRREGEIPNVDSSSKTEEKQVFFHSATL